MKFFRHKRGEKGAGTEDAVKARENSEDGDGDGDPEKEMDSKTTATIEPTIGATVEPTAEEVVYVTGWKLWSMLASLVLIFFLFLLDTSIVATVRLVTSSCYMRAKDFCRPYQKSPPTSIHCAMWAGMVARICWPSKYHDPCAYRKIINEPSAARFNR
jgi:hypothetical protein